MLIDIIFEALGKEGIETEMIQLGDRPASAARTAI